MLLVVDVGNTHTCLGVFRGESLIAELRLTTRRAWTDDELELAITQGLALRKIELSALEGAIVACVVPPAQRALERALARVVGADPIVVGPGTKTGMTIRYEPAGDVGADRIVSALAAHHRYGRPDRGVLVVDFGTATTFDVVSPKLEYLGGAIAPGLGIGADALFARAARLPRVDIARPSRVVGRTTVGALQSGLVYGYVSLIEGMISRIRAELEFEVSTVATGGFAELLCEGAALVDSIDASLMLEGLRLIYARRRRR